MSSGISPSVEPAKYFVAATLKSNVQGTCMSTTVAGPKPAPRGWRGSRAGCARSGSSDRAGRRDRACAPVPRADSAARDLDLNLAAESDGVDGLHRRRHSRSATETRAWERRRRERPWRLDLEAQIRHWRLRDDLGFGLRSSAKKRPTSSQTSVPPERPFQLVRIRPTSL